jgi:predicted Mrr-cat superfamily restriction endonuclease
MKKPDNAFVLRQSPSGINQMESISLRKNVLVNGWSKALGLIEEKDEFAFREILRKQYYRKEKTLQKAGYARGTMWRFLKEMKVGNWVVVPHSGRVFYVAEITGDAFYDDSAAAKKADSCYRRPVRWLNNKRPIQRICATAKLISRMKTRQTSAEAKDLIDEIHKALCVVANNGAKSAPQDSNVLFADQLRLKLVEAALKEIQQGYIDNFKFEHLIRRILLVNGATDVKIVSRRLDKGVDIIATFLIGRDFQIRLGVQAKHYIGKMATKNIDQLLKGMEEEGLSFGWFVTSGEFEEDAEEYLTQKLAKSSMQVSLVDGEQLAGMIIDSGLENVATSTK